MRPLLRIATVFIAAAMAAIDTASARRDSLPGQKSVFRYEYPAYLAFRGEMNRLTRTDRRAWVESVDSAAGFMKKFISEELEIDPQMAVRANTYAAEHSEKLALLHLNGEARRIWGHPEVLERYFPGHWVYRPGAKVTADLSAGDTEVRVADVTPFLGPGYPDQRATPKRYLPLQVLLVRLGPDGERLWYESEYAELVSVDPQRGCLTLKRGLHGSRQMDFAAGAAYVAPMAGGVWGGRVMWFYNLSSACPQDRRGRRANECYADEIASWFGPDGRLSAFDGIAFDVNYFDVSERGAQWDVDNNGTADGGWIAGRNVWEEGDLAFLARVREQLGDDRILSADAQHASNQQVPSLLDGMESEGLVQHNDMWRGFSRALNTHLYWTDHRRSAVDYRYVVMKVLGPDAPEALRMRRFGAAVANCIGAFTTDVPGRGHLPEPFRTPGSLGRVKGPLIRYAEGFEPVVSLSGKELAERLTSSGCGVAVRESGVEVSAPGGTESCAEGEIPEIRLTLRGLNLPEGDAVFVVRARLEEPASASAAEYEVPARLWLRPDSLPVYDTNAQYNEYFCNLYGLFGCDRTEPMSYYFRDLKPALCDVTLIVRGARRFVLERVEVRNAPDVVMREFEHGFVVANPSLHPVEIDVGRYCERAAGRTVVVPAVDAVYVAF